MVVRVRPNANPTSQRYSKPPIPKLKVDSIPIGCRIRRKRGRLPSNVSIRSDSAVPIPPLLGTRAPNHSR